MLGFDTDLRFCILLVGPVTHNSRAQRTVGTRANDYPTLVPRLRLGDATGANLVYDAYENLARDRQSVLPDRRSAAQAHRLPGDHRGVPGDREARGAEAGAEGRRRCMVRDTDLEDPVILPGAVPQSWPHDWTASADLGVLILDSRGRFVRKGGRLTDQRILSVRDANVDAARARGG